MDALAPRIDQYLEQLQRHLGGTGNDRALVLDDVRSHIHESLVSLDHTPSDADLQRILNELGDPAQIAAEFSANNVQTPQTLRSRKRSNTPLIFGALALVTYWLGPIPFMLAIMAIGTGVAVLREEPPQANRVSAWIGIVLAIVALVLVFVLFIGPALSSWFMALL